MAPALGRVAHPVRPHLASSGLGFGSGGVSFQPVPQPRGHRQSGKAEIGGVYDMKRQSVGQRFDTADARISQAMARAGIPLLRVALGLIYLWFGVLKLIPGMSPAEDLVLATVPIVPGGLFMPFLGLWEITIGLGFLTGRVLRIIILMLFLQMPGTLSPIFLLPHRVFTVFPFGLTLEGQYIVKNLVLISAALVIGATVRGGSLVQHGEPTR